MLDKGNGLSSVSVSCLLFNIFSQTERLSLVLFKISLPPSHLTHKSETECVSLFLSLSLLAYFTTHSLRSRGTKVQLLLFLLISTRYDDDDDDGEDS